MFEAKEALQEGDWAPLEHTTLLQPQERSQRSHASLAGNGACQAITKGWPGGKLPIGNLTFLSPFWSLSEASRNAATKRANAS